MRTYKTTIIPEHNSTSIDQVFCDLCGEVRKHQLYAVSDVVVSYEFGNAYSDNGSTTQLSYDICGSCFRNKLMVWLESQGAEPRKEEKDW